MIELASQFETKPEECGRPRLLGRAQSEQALRRTIPINLKTVLLEINDLGNLSIGANDE
jgi:hypothetical protein